MNIPEGCLGVRMKPQNSEDVYMFIYPDSEEARYYFEGCFIEGGE